MFPEWALTVEPVLVKRGSLFEIVTDFARARDASEKHTHITTAATRDLYSYIFKLDMIADISNHSLSLDYVVYTC
eukprot:m.225705 g.225705  ORF g.225705 m.225705 type:complete len:75 (-) comp33468_c0_seq4:59-283(-)